MAIARMKLVNIVGRLKDFDEVVQKCCIKGDFHPEPASLAVENVEEFVPIEVPNPYERATQKAVDIGVHSDIRLGYRNFDSLGMDYDKLAEYMDDAGNELDKLNGRVGELSRDVTRLEQVLTYLQHLKNFGISLDDIFGCKNVIFRFGRLPKDSYMKINSDDEYDSRLFFPLEEDDLYYWGFYVAEKENEAESEEFYASLYFERISIIEQTHGTPAQAYEQTGKDLAIVRSELEKAKQAVRLYWEENQEKFLTVYSKLKYLHDTFDIRKYAAKCDESFYIFGWVPEKEISSFTKQFDHIANVDCIVENTDEAENVEPPTSLVNNKFFKPFEMFLGMYGLPIYNEIDPTPLLALTYTIMYGIMFADLGQGAIVFGIGLLLWIKKKMPLGAIMYRIGASSMVFGFLYNELFGYEFLPFTVLKVNPIRYSGNTVYLLGAAIGMGILIILVSMCLNIVNGIRQKRVDKLLFSANGVAGMIFYLTVLVSCALYALLKIGLSPIALILLIILPLLLIALSEPLTGLIERHKDWKPEKPGEFAVTAFFEVFESLLSYVTNTISFVRVGAYVLSHAGMMTAIFALADLGGKVGGPIILLIGNVFVIMLEGFISGIQGIRLEYYEIFSRFYNGTGKEYSPLRIHYN